MIVVDTSAIVSIIRQEEDALALADVIDEQDRALMSAVSFVETSMVVNGRRLDVNLANIEDILAAMSIEIVPLSVDDGKAAVSGFMRFGKGRHRARLNFADCFSYGLAKSRNLPLLFKGDDFLHTDLVPAWRP
ncbi:type II toxin-antitoxin system VapC family toxin [Pseudorhodoplanes sp.]|uniref:type II toxin-antitoxin system VapC family toxin n=1 Tax=Pseudorhodoplanes sp. TaxID=1934341 RepID=UPI00391A8C34